MLQLQTFLFSLSSDRGREFLCRCRSKGYRGWWLCGRHILQESIVSQQRWRRQRHGGRGRRPGSHRGHIRRLCLSQRERDCCCCRGKPPRRHTVGQDCQKCKETSSPLADKQQKTGEHVENIKFSLNTQLYFMFSTCSPVFCCLSARA